MQQQTDEQRVAGVRWTIEHLLNALALIEFRRMDFYFPAHIRRHICTVLSLLVQNMCYRWEEFGLDSIAVLMAFALIEST